MSDWDLDDDLTGQRPQRNTPISGPPDLGLFAAALICVALVSFGVAWWTRNIPSRPFWMLGCCFAAPVAALMLSVFAKEKISSAMTPSTSRKAQFLLTLGCIATAFVVGCFCQVTNEKADSFVQQVVGEGWSDVLVVLDKSGSMGGDRDRHATDALRQLLNQMDEETRVGLLIDVDWENDPFPGYPGIPLNRRMLPLSPLTAEHRQDMLRMIDMEPTSTGNFPMAFETVCSMLSPAGGEQGPVSVVLISDGEDITGVFNADDYAGRLTDAGATVNYLCVAQTFDSEVARLATATGGKNVLVQHLDQLMAEMRQVITVPVYTVVYKDALRDLQESETARIVTGILLLLLGVMIGVSLSVMLSVQGQRRFQLLLSPLAAIAAWLFLTLGARWITVPWVREGVAFSCFGLVCMRKNNMSGTRAVSEVQQAFETDTGNKAKVRTGRKPKPSGVRQTEPDDDW